MFPGLAHLVRATALCSEEAPSTPRRVPKKKDLFDPTNDKWVHDKFDLPPDQDLDYDTVRITDSPTRYL